MKLAQVARSPECANAAANDIVWYHEPSANSKVKHNPGISSIAAQYMTVNEALTGRLGPYATRSIWYFDRWPVRWLERSGPFPLSMLSTSPARSPAQSFVAERERLRVHENPRGKGKGERIEMQLPYIWLLVSLTRESYIIKSELTTKHLARMG